MKLTTISGHALAATALTMTVAGAATQALAQDGEEAKIHCEGVNTCKGSSDCKTADNECAGMNACKGQGFVALTAKQCGQIGGTVGS